MMLMYVTENEGMERIPSLTDSTPVCLHLFRQFDKVFKRNKKKLSENNLRHRQASIRQIYQLMIRYLCYVSKEFMKISGDDIIYVEEATRVSHSHSLHHKRGMTNEQAELLARCLGKSIKPVEKRAIHHRYSQRFAVQANWT